jgi:hypothetical protein
MPVNYSFDNDLFCLRLVGTYTPNDVKNALQSALADSDMPPQPRFMFDVTESQSLAERSSNDVRDMANFLGSYAEALGQRMAIVATGPLYFGLMRMGSAYTGSHNLETEVFSDRESAISWLGRDPKGAA